MALKHKLLFLLTIACCVAYGTATRDLVMYRPKQDLVNCWSYLMELKSCSNEIANFLTNGREDMSPNCCCAITMITRNCRPVMLTSLGFKAQEGHYLRGYCDATASSPGLAPDGDGPVISIEYPNLSNLY